MKKICIIISSLLIASGVCLAQPEATFQKANKAYKDSQYPQAISLYESVLQEGHQSFELLYNLGNAYYRNDEIARAILCYERAHLLKPHDVETIQNLELAYSKTTDQIDRIPELFIVRWFNSIVDLMSPKGWQIVLLAVLALLMGQLVAFFLCKNYKIRKTLFLTGLLTLMLLFCVIVDSVASCNRSYRNSYAIVTVPAAEVKGSPETSSVEKFSLHEGTKVKIADHLNGWFKITIADGNSGWLTKNEVELIVPQNRFSD